MESKVIQALENASNPTLAKHILQSYKEVERNYFLKSWKTSALDAGHFVEAVRRLLEHNLLGTYPPIGKSLSPLNDRTMQTYLNSTGDDSYRIHIPRMLLSIYGIRNKRGVGHLSTLNPNYLDATIIISTVKWILAEVIRINSPLSLNEISIMIDTIVDRPIEGIWEQGDITRILVDGLSLKEQVVFLLFSTSITKDEDLRTSIEYNNRAYFRRILRQMHSSRTVEYNAETGSVTLSPKGISYAEDLINNKISNGT